MFDPSKLHLDLDDSKNENTDISGNKPLPKEDSGPALDQTENTSMTEETIDKAEVREEKTINEEIEKKEEEIVNSEEVQNTTTEATALNIEQETIIEAEKKEIVFVINITNVSSLVSILMENKYDFLIIEPSEEAIKIIFKKDKVEKEARYIKYPIYTDIVIKTKTLTKLKIDVTDAKQEGKGELNIVDKGYTVASKIVPGNYGEKIFIKATEIERKKENTKEKKASFGKILGFPGATGLISLILGGTFVTFIVLNANTPEDVKFFLSLGISLNDINTFITKIISIIFSTLIFIETIFLIFFLFKLLLTKKEEKQKRIKYFILGTLFLIITFLSVSAWMMIDRKVKSLPNWQEMSYGDIRVYDNDKLISEDFNTKNSIIENTKNIIGPITIKYDLSFFAKKEKDKGIQIQKYIWDFGDGEAVETLEPVFIKVFDKKGNYEVSLIVKELDLKGSIIDKPIGNVPSINIANIVEIVQTPLNNGGKIIELDASSLSQLGKIEWYFLDDLNNPAWKGYTFKLPKPIFKETIIGMYIKQPGKTSETLDKVFIITPGDENKIAGEITYNRGIINDLEFDFGVKNIENEFGEGYIQEFLWEIDGKTITKEGSINDQEGSSKVTFKFKTYGDKNISVTLTNSDNKSKTLSLDLNIPKKLNLSKNLQILQNESLLEDVEYDKNNNEYFINEIGVPTLLKFDARFVKADNSLYTLEEVEWDYNSDGDVDYKGKTLEHEISTPGNHIIEATYYFVHRKIKDNKVEVTESIYIEGVKKDAILDIKIEKPNNYAPITVRFDASKSRIKNDDIVSFIWDYGDGIIENRDSIVPGHKYTTSGNYIIKLKVVTEKGKEYEIEKKLILIPKPQNVVISTSLKSAPVYQGIDFSSNDSEGQITSYFWDFGDGTNSVEANPTHVYSKPGEYKVKLQLDFANKNVLHDEVDIEIFEE